MGGFLLDSIGVDNLVSNDVCVSGAIVKKLICCSVVTTRGVSPGVRPCCSALPENCSVLAGGRVREFQFVVSKKVLSVAARLENEEVEARGSEVSRRALLASAVVKFKSWSQLTGGCPWWLGRSSQLSRCYTQSVSVQI